MTWRSDCGIGLVTGAGGQGKVAWGAGTAPPCSAAARSTLVTSEGAWRAQVIPSWGRVFEIWKGVAESLASGSEGSESGRWERAIAPRSS